MKLSFVFPVYNEEKNLAYCIREIWAIEKSLGLQIEIIVVDNNSNDSSYQIAKQLGVKLIKVLEKGYGKALKEGINAASNEWVAFADADSTYELFDLKKMIEVINRRPDVDLVVADRINGKIEKFAMPLLHRYVGTPLLTHLIEALYGIKVGDCNSGFRLFRKSEFEKWNLISQGMEFASEMIVKAAKSDSKIASVSSGLRQSKFQRSSHLRPVIDGLRHLKVIFQHFI